MKKYKLLKSIVTMDLIAKAGEIGVLKDGKVWFDNGRYFYPEHYMDMYPDWFALEVEKDWTVEVFSERNDQCWYRNDNGKYVHQSFITTGEQSISFDDCIKNNLSIYRVKRLSDNEVFSVGDEVVWDWKNCYLNYFTIKGFEIICDGSLQIHTNEGSGKYDFNTLSEYNLRKFKKVESKEVFTWDEVFRVVRMYVGSHLIDEHEFKKVLYAVKQSHQSSIPDTKERIEVSDVFVSCGGQTFGRSEWFGYQFNSETIITKDKLLLIKQVIENTLNDEVSLSTKVVKNIMQEYGAKFYTQQQMDKARRDAFDAAKDLITDPSNDRQLIYKYPTLESYLETLK